MTAPLLQVTDLTKAFPVKGRAFFGGHAPMLKAVDGISFDLVRGETLGLVGESGCGKSTTARLILRLVEPTGGSIVLDGRDSVLQPIAGAPPNLIDLPPGCPFRPRCVHAVERCATELPPLRKLVEGHQVACHLAVAS